MTLSRFCVFHLVVPMTEPPNLEAFLTVKPVQSNFPQAHLLSRASIYRFLKKAGIVFGVLESAVTKILDSGQAENILIAKGISPLEGSHAYFQSLVEAQQDYYAALFSNISELGSQDWHVCLNQSLVMPKTPLLRKHPPKRGAPGCDIFGKIIPGKMGKDVPFPILQNASIASQDKSLMVSTIKGIPHIMLPELLEVQPVTLLERDLETSMYFKGTVMVDGNIQDLVRLRAEGDIFVSGTVDGAVLIAGQNIWIGHGIKGKEVGVLKAENDIIIGFAESATLEAGRNVFARSLSHCHTVALSQVQVAHIVGGETLASIQIKSNVIGSRGVSAFVGVGFNDYLETKLLECQKEIAALREEVDFLKLKMTDKAFLLDKQKFILKQHYMYRIPLLEYRLQDLLAKLADLQGLQERAKSGCIEAETCIYSGTWLKIQGFEKHVDQQAQGPHRFVAGKYGILFKESE